MKTKKVELVTLFRSRFDAYKEEVELALQLLEEQTEQTGECD